MLGQMMEQLNLKKDLREIPVKDWAANGLNGRAQHNVINSLYLKPEALENQL